MSLEENHRDTEHHHHHDRHAHAHGHAQGHGHHHGHGHSHGHGVDNWSGEDYLQFPGMKETALKSHESVLHTLQGADITPEQVSTMSLIEIGCGAGAVTKLYAESFASVHAIDTSTSMLLAFSDRLPPKTTYSLHALSEDSPKDFQDGKEMFSPTKSEQERKLAPPRARFDIAVANLVLHHVDNLDGFMAGVVGLLNQGGWFVITEFAKNEDEGGHDHAHHHGGHSNAHDDELERGKKLEGGSVNAPNHFHAAFSVDSITDFLKKYGFTDVHAEIRGKLPVWEDPAKYPSCLIARGRKP
ncbi:S-adenosyl-L-methionine-dependent methyltransferase [Kockovaella imperatae]|uniref:S-adenosyl-L-methionine-dependent methyltransferase n=1 Tax=Kockovaella imperatae TaxID=4999 RepID=A0A1Y1US74_9TREE|nr:S-adenosyl-L-methionine-dependent methyltransferase [Kockovaella imperatae]ORX40839.1 S-adenosyl-L-methionine-dependent methyltransferase [Kockovaella imperatae]